MTKEQIIKFLKRKRRWIGIKEIAEKTKLSNTKITGSLGMLVKQGYILKKPERIDGILFNFYKLK